MLRTGRQRNTRDVLPVSYSFTPIAVETMGEICLKSMAFLKDLHVGRRIAMDFKRAEVNGLFITMAICGSLCICAQDMNFYFM